MAQGKLRRILMPAPYRLKMRIEAPHGDPLNDWERVPDRWDHVGTCWVQMTQTGSDEVVEGPGVVTSNTYAGTTPCQPLLLNTAHRLVSMRDGKIFEIESAIDADDRRMELQLRLLHTTGRIAYGGQV